MIFSREDRKVDLSLSAKIAVCLSAALIIFGAATVITLDAFSSNVTIKNGGSTEIEILTFKKTVGEVLLEQGITLSEYDKASVALNEPLYDDMTIEVYRSIPVSITAGGETKTVHTTKRVIKDILAEAGFECTTEDEISPSRNKIAKADTNIVLIKRTNETVTLTEEVPFAVTEKPNASLSRGIKKVIQKGQNGQSERTYKISYADGVEVEREMLSETVVSGAVEEIVEVGTKKTRLDDYTIAYDGSITTSRSGTLSYSRVISCSATAYDAVSCGKQPGYAKTATGAIAQRGVIAVDPSVIPLGTRVFVEGYGYAIAADTGGAIRGNIIDVCMDSRAESLSWGRRNVKVYILN